MAITNALIKRIEDVKNEGNAFTDLNFHKNKRAEIEKVFLPSFDNLLKQFSDLTIAYENLKSIAGLGDISIEFDLIRNSLIALKDKISKDEYDKQQVLLLSKTVKDNYNVLFEIWKKYISDKTSARTEMLATIDKLIADMPEKTVLQQKKAIFSRPGIGAPESVNAINEYIKIYDELMNKLNLKDNVSEFLKKLSSGERISIAEMDDEVYKWIKSSDFAKKILLKIN